MSDALLSVSAFPPRPRPRSTKPRSSDWVGLLAVTDSNKAKASLGNLRVLLENHPDWEGAFAFDDRAQRIMVMRSTPLDVHVRADARAYPRPFSDVDATRIAMWGDSAPLSSSIEPGISMPPDRWHAAILVDAERFRFDPVRTYLESLAWDGVPRLDTWLFDFMGAHADDERARRYVRAVGAAWMISAVARTFAPGCKADCVLIVEGRQGIKKSTAFATLASTPWFTDEAPPLGSKDAAMHVHGPWIIELAELDSIRRAEVTTTKSFLSRSVDRFRPPYGRTQVDIPRRCVFAATTNEEAYLQDTTGNRRFWPVKATRIDIEGLRASRDQLWAESVARYRDGAPWYLTDADDERAAIDEQAARARDDSWDEKIAEYVHGRDYVTIADLLETALDIPAAKQGHADILRITGALKRFQWSRKQRRIAGKQTWVYIPRTPEGGE